MVNFVKLYCHNIEFISTICIQDILSENSILTIKLPFIF